ncbi:5706_t:CDS:2 [Diversispora eburnea]|uniref:5706_t:CDS:1 n=1 Tax=Diversispora eburnea TaxID=1213867 RepID=A0A9N8W0Y8_9GLOM|nr:5706_t:CDS:2 [Diversispora eburnea]
MGKNGVKSIPQKTNKASTVKPAATKKIVPNKKRNISKKVESDSDVSSDEKKNGNKKNSNDSDTSEDSSEDSSEEDSSSDSDEKTTTKIQNKKSSKVSSSDSTSDSSESDSSSNDKEKKVVKTKNGSTFILSKDSSSEDDDSSESDSKSENKQEKLNVSAQQNGAKRKQDEQKFSSPKKTKINDDDSSNCTVFVGNLSYNIDEDRLAQELEEAGEITDVRIIYDKESGRPKGFGYVEFSNSESAKKALSFSGKDVDGRSIKVDLADQKPKNGGGGNANNNNNGFQKDLSEPSDTLFIGNLSFTAEEDTIWKTFEKYGQINSVRLPTFPDTGGRKGFGYVTFTDVTSAQEAMELQGTRIDGRAVRLDFAAPPQQSFESSSPRRGGNRGGYRGGGFGDNNRGGSPGRMAANKGTIVPGRGKKIVFDE